MDKKDIIYGIVILVLSTLLYFSYCGNIKTEVVNQDFMEDVLPKMGQ